MKVIFIVSGGRNGSLFFQSLLDNHDEILQLPGVFHLDYFIKNIKGNSSQYLIAESFTNLFPEFFDSRKNSLHRMGELGQSKKDYFLVSKEKFIKNYLKLTSRKSNINIPFTIKAIHLAYYFAKTGKNVSNHKLISIHIHNAKRLEKIFKYFEIYEPQSLFIERDIIPSFHSELKGWSTFFDSDSRNDIRIVEKINKYSSSLYRKIFAPYCLHEIDSNSLTIKLEDIHLNTRFLFQVFADKYGIKFSETFFESTFNGLFWWGDKISSKYLNGINKNFKNNFDKNIFFDWELKLIKVLVSKRSKKYGYNFLSSRLPLRILFFLPSKFEFKLILRVFKIFLRENLKNKLLILIRLKEIFIRKLKLFCNYSQNKSIPDLFL